METMKSVSDYVNRVTSGPPLQQHEEMSLEVLRLASYDNWPHWATKRPGNLSENGFYYCGDKDRVCCFACGTEISNWSLDDKVSEKHRSLSPHCSFILGNDTNNVPFECGSDLPTTKKRLHCDSLTNNDSGYGSVENFTSAGASNDPKPEKNLESNSLKEIDSLLEEAKSLGSLSSGSRSAASNDIIDNPKVKVVKEEKEPETEKVEEVSLQFVKYESYRLRTFEGNWSDDFFVSPAELAKAGFFFLSGPDRVQCAFCRGRLLNWKPTDVPLAEHRRHFPDCPFIQKRNVGNVPIEQSLKSVQYPEHLKEKEKKKEQSPSERLGIMMDKPKHPDFAIEASRLDSFKTWPKNAKVPAAKLAGAGFFYVGYSDNVKCFFCDGGLRNWDTGDDPWREHARWFSRCGYVKLQMGEEYVNKVISDSKNTANGGRKTEQTHDKISKQPKRKSPPPYDPRDLKARMDTPMVRTVMGMGFAKDLISKVIEMRLKTEGDDFPNAEELLQALFDEQEARQMEQDRKDISDQTAAAATATKDSKPGLSRRKKRNRKKKNKKAAADEDTKSAAALDSDSEVDEMVEVIDESTMKMVQEDEEVKSLAQQYQRIKEERTCKICMDEECTIVFLPCGHLVCCANCAPALRSCPICRTTIKGSVRIFTT